MLISLNGKGLVSSLIEMSAADILIVGMPALRVREREPVHEVGQLAVGAWPQQEVPVIGHEAIAGEPHAGDVFQGLGEDALERLEVARLLEDGRAAIAA